jgi:hypothetical protein
MQHAVRAQACAPLIKSCRTPSIHLQAEGREHEILCALNVPWPPRRGHTHINCPTIGHADRNPSWRWDARKQRWCCTCGAGNIVDLAMAVLGYDFVNAADWIRREVLSYGLNTPHATIACAKVSEKVRETKDREREQADAEHKAQRLELARRIYSRSFPAAGTIVETYLRSRRILIPAPCTFRFLPAAEKYPHPRMVAPYCLSGPDGLAIQGVHLTQLKPDGSGKADLPRGEVRRSIAGHGWPVELAPPNDLLGLAICEGLETGLSIAQETGLGVWAAGSASWMPALASRVPSYIECVTIYAEADGGRRHAYRLADLLDARGFEVLVAEAPQ